MGDHSDVDGLSVGHLMVLRVRNKRVIVSLDVLIWASTKLVNPSPKVRILCCLNDFNYKKEKNIFNRYKWKMHKTAQTYFKGLYMNTCMVVNKHAEDHSGKYTSIHKHTIMKLNAHLTSKH